MDIPKESITRISKFGENIVLIGNDFLDNTTNCVVIDNFAGVQLMMQHLFQAGHRKIALLSEQPVYNDIKERIRAYHYCMEEAGYSEFRHVVYANGSGIADGELVGTEWIENGLHHSAVLVSNDMLAIGLMKAVKSAGLQIPRDISVAGFDGTWVSSIVDPPLTSVVQPMFDMGSAAITLLMEFMKSPGTPARKIVLSPTLKIGGTIANKNATE